MRLLVNPVLVGRFAGAQGVGFVALAIRLVEVLSFIKQATWRVAMAALAKLDETGSDCAEALLRACVFRPSWSDCRSHFLPD